MNPRTSSGINLTSTETAHVIEKKGTQPLT
ncbi:hypothetical protein HDC95_000997 [Microbacterium sp. AK031]|nr:hypothetical protein [Microbacterium sp. AK031]